MPKTLEFWKNFEFDILGNENLKFQKLKISWNFKNFYMQSNEISIIYEKSTIIENKYVSLIFLDTFKVDLQYLSQCCYSSKIVFQLKLHFILKMDQKTLKDLEKIQKTFGNPVNINFVFLQMKQKLLNLAAKFVYLNLKCISTLFYLKFLKNI